MKKVSRREFISGTSAAAMAAASGLPAWAYEQNEPTIKVGLIGCGGRGTGAVEQCLESSPNVQVIALGDMFEDRLKKCRKQLEAKEHSGWKVQDDHCFTGFDAYKRVIDSGVDLVLLTQPPGFRVPHFKAAIDAGKHVFFEKPVAVDPWGVRQVIEWGEKAREKKLAIVTGTQSRHSAKIIETVRRVHEGQIGRITGGRIYFNTGYLWSYERRPEWSDMEWQIRNWYYFDWLSGDHIVEQHVHQHDVTNWVMQANPVKATATGGRQVRTEPLWGNIWDHFTVDYEYPNDVHVFSMCRQWDKAPGKTGAWFEGSKGWANVMHGEIGGENPWKWDGKERQSQVQEHADLIASIRAGKPLNHARRIAESSLVAILGREAAYTGKVVSWDQIMNSKLNLTPPRYEFGPHEANPIPVPGKNTSDRL